MNNLYIGTCSWNYDSWVGLVYTRKERTAVDYLEEYARHFNSAEIDSWFYKIPDPLEAASYAKHTPDDFIFTCKVYEKISLTHERNWDKSVPLEKNNDFLSVSLYAKYLDAIAPLAGKIGLLIFEFEYLSREKMESIACFIDKFQNFYSKIEKPFPIGIEIRNKNFLTPEYFSFLAENSIIHVFSEKQYMPPVSDVFARFRDYIGTTLAIRLLGGDRTAMEKKTGNQWNRIVEERPEKMGIVDIALDTKFDRGKVIINVNNHYEGSAPLTIAALRGLLQRRADELKHVF